MGPLSTYLTLSIDQPPCDTPSLHSNSKLHLYLLSTPPSYIPSLHTQHCRILYYYPPLTFHFCTPTLNFISTSSLHPLSICPLCLPLSLSLPNSVSRSLSLSRSRSLSL